MTGAHARGPALALLVALSAIAIHLPWLLERPFFFGDDFGLLADAVNLSDGSSSFFELPAWGVWRFGQRGLSWAEYTLFGLDPGPAHLINVLLHGIASALVLALALKLLTSPREALLAGLLFATLAKPSFTVRYPSVAAVEIAAIFSLLALLLHGARRPGLATLAMLLGALFYEQALAVVPMLLLLNLERRRPWREGLVAPAVGALLFVLLNYLSLRHETKVFAYNPGGLSALWQVLAAPAATLGFPPDQALPALVVLLALALTARSGRRGTATGAGLAWAAVLPMLGRAQGWPDWYYYLSAAGVSLATVAALPRKPWRPLWELALLALVIANVGWQRPLARGFLQDTRNYEIASRATPAEAGHEVAVLLNLHSGLAWTAWQYGGSVRRFELWDAPGVAPRALAGADLDALRTELLRAVPGASRRVRFPEDLPRAMWETRAPGRKRLFAWPPATP